MFLIFHDLTAQPSPPSNNTCLQSDGGARKSNRRLQLNSWWSAKKREKNLHIPLKKKKKGKKRRVLKRCKMFFQGGKRCCSHGRAAEGKTICVCASERANQALHFFFFFCQMQNDDSCKIDKLLISFFFFSTIYAHRSGQVAASSRLGEFTLSQRRPHSRSLLDPGNFENSMLFLFNNSSKSNILHQTDTFGRLLLRCLPLLFSLFLPLRVFLEWYF